MSSWLKALFNNLKSDGKDAFDLAMISAPPSPNLHDIKVFGDQDSNLAVSVFGNGMKMERAAVDFYEKAKADSDNEAAIVVYSKLIEWEEQHYQQFAQAYE